MARDVTFALRKAGGQFAAQAGQVSVEVDWVPLVALLDRAGASVEQFQDAVLAQLARNLEVEAPKRTGRLSKGFRVQGDRVINLWDYMRFVISGTGVFGPT